MVRTLEHVRIACELHAARGTALRDIDTYATEAWAALATDDPEAATERIEAFTERSARIIDPARLTLAMKIGYHHRFGPPTSYSRTRRDPWRHCVEPRWPVRSVCARPWSSSPRTPRSESWRKH